MSGQGLDIGRRLTLDEIDFIRPRGGRGFRWVGRYVGAGDKAMDTTEISGLLSRGLGILPIFELGGAGPWTLTQGEDEGQQARTDALSVGVPLGTPLIASTIDAQVPPDSLVDFLNGVFAGLDGAFIDGIYGDFDICERARESFPALGFFMQTYAWSGPREYAYPAADVYQHANGVTLRDGLVVDLCFAHSPIPWRMA